MGKLGGPSTPLGNRDEIINEVWDECNKLANDKIPFDKLLYENVLWERDIQVDGEIGTINLADGRTMQFLRAYTFYKSAPWKFSESAVWFEVFEILDRILGTRL